MASATSNLTSLTPFLTSTTPNYTLHDVKFDVKNAIVDIKNVKLDVNNAIVDVFCIKSFTIHNLQLTIIFIFVFINKILNQGLKFTFRMNLKNSQLEVDNWIKNHGVRYFNELTNMAQLTEEVGEVARIIARRYGEQSEKESDKNKDLGEELADVVFVVLCLANQTGIDLQAAFDKKMDLKTNRDHDRHHNNEKLK